MEPIILETQGGHKVIIKHATAVEKRAHRRKALEIDAVEGISLADRLDRLEDSLFEIFVESVDGKSEDINSIILSLPAVDYGEIVDKCKEMLSGMEKKSDER